MYTDLCTYAYTYVYIHIYTYIYLYIHIYTHIYTYKYIHTYVYIYIYMYTHMYIYMYIHTYTYMYTYIYIFFHIHIYTTHHSARLHTTTRNNTLQQNSSRSHTQCLEIPFLWLYPYTLIHIMYPSPTPPQHTQTFQFFIFSAPPGYTPEECMEILRRDAKVQADMSREVKSLQHTATHCNTRQKSAWRFWKETQKRRQMWVARYNHCNTLQHTGTRCNTLQHTATRWDTLQPTATRWDTRGCWKRT